MNSVLEQKKERITKLFQRQKSDKVPMYLYTDGYLAYYSGYEMNDITDYDIAMKVTKKAYSDLDVDCGPPYIPYNVWLNPTFKLWDGAIHRIGPDGVLQIIPSEIEIMRPEEYPEFIKDPAVYLLEKVFPRRYGVLKQIDPQEKYERLADSFALCGQFAEYNAKAEEECGVVSIGSALIFNPIDIIFDLLRNFTGIMRDIRRCPEDLRDAGIAMVDQMLSAMSSVPKESYRAIEIPMHLPPFIKSADFEKVYWPSYKKLAYGLVAQGHNIEYLFEKNYSHLYEFLQDLPDKNILGMFEEDDLKVVKQKLGKTMAFGGGLSRNMLYHASKEECINHTKLLIDEFGTDGGYIVSPEMPMMFGIDAKRENIKAITETVATYGKY